MELIQISSSILEVASMNSILNVLVIEDDIKISRFLELELSHEGYDVQLSFDGRLALELIEKEMPDIILLDVMLPGINGIEVCRRIRKISSVPVIMLTAKDGIIDRVVGLDSGADDYLTKPFAIEELLARMRALLRRNNLIENDTTLTNLKIGDITVDIEQHIVKKSDTIIDLSKKEFDLLVFLIRNEGIVLSRDKIIEKVWGYDFNGETNVVDVYIRYLRSKIDEPFSDAMIQTIRGVGYTIRNVKN